MLIGHASVQARLMASARAGRLSHALLLTGPEQVGKTTTALALAVELLEAEAWPGGPLAHPDLWLEDSDSQNIHIGRVRLAGTEGPTLQDFLSLRPYAGGRRVAVMGRADRLTEQAADCMLKTLEEPPPATHLILCAAHAERLPATILSRCELVALSPASASEIIAWLIERGVPEETAAAVAPLSAGRPGRALRLAGDPEALRAEIEALNLFLSAGGTGTAGGLSVASKFAFSQNWEGRERALVVLAAWAMFVRDAACFAAGTPELAAWAAYRGALERWAEAMPAGRIVEILGRIVGTADAVSANAQPRLAFEALLLDVFAGADSPPKVDELPPAPAVNDGAEGSPTRRRRGAPQERSRGGD